MTCSSSLPEPGRCEASGMTCNPECRSIIQKKLILIKFFHIELFPYVEYQLLKFLIVHHHVNYSLNSLIQSPSSPGGRGPISHTKRSAEHCRLCRVTVPRDLDRYPG